MNMAAMTKVDANMTENHLHSVTDHHIACKIRNFVYTFTKR